MTEKATIPSPADFDWSWDDITLVVGGKTHYAAQERAVIDRLPGLHPAIIRAWLVAWRAREKNKVSEGAGVCGEVDSVPSEVQEASW